MSETFMEISKIVVGDRYRKDLGDIAGLAQSITRVGLLHPIVVTPEGKLIAGQRRLAAAKHLGWTEVPVHVVDLQDILLGESDENACRKTLTPSEQVAIAEAVDQLERERAKERQREHGGTAPGRKNTPGNFPDVSRGDRRDRVAKAVGVSAPTLKKAQAVVRAAEADPVTFGPVQEEMDATGKVDPAFRKVVELKAEHAEAAPESGTVREKGHRAALVQSSGVEQMLSAARGITSYFEGQVKSATAEEDLKDIRYAARKVADRVQFFFKHDFRLSAVGRDIDRRIGALKSKAAVDEGAEWAEAEHAEPIAEEVSR